MKELSNLNQLVNEIKFFESQAVNSYWEIGKRLSQAKEQVPHGEWENWVEDNLGYSLRTTQQLIRVHKEYSKTNTYSFLSFNKVLALTSIEDEEERQEFAEDHDVEDMTVRELKAEIKEYKRSLEKTANELEETVKEKDEEIGKLRLSNNSLYGELQIEKSRSPEVIEKEVIKEIEPEDYKQIKETLKQLQKDNEELKNKLMIESDKKKEAINQLAEEQQKEELIREINGFAWTINGFIKDVGGLIYLADYIDEVPPASKKLFKSSAETLEQWASQLIYNINNKES